MNALSKSKAIQRGFSRSGRIVLAGILVLVALLAAAMAIDMARRPARTRLAEDLFQGITYTRRVRSQPRPLVIHVVSIDLTTPGVRILVTPRDGRCGMDTCAMTTGAFVEKYGVQLAVNGSFFKPFYAHDYTLDGYYPHSGDPVDVLGLAISNGKSYSRDEAGFAKICFTAKSAQITQGVCPKTTIQALAGGEILVKNGKAVNRGYDGGINPRTAAGIDKAGKRLWLIVVDGRQPGYSEGVTLNELAGIAVQVGATTALNLDGGGSSTLAAALDGVHTLNSPIHTRIPMRQRPVAIHLGIYALK